MNKIDTTKPLEAVNKATGKVVPMEFASAEDSLTEGAFRTKKGPCNSTSNNTWYADGRDYCHHNQWFIRNVASDAIDPSKPLQTTDGRKATLVSRPNPGEIYVKIEGKLRPDHSIEGLEWTFKVSDGCWCGAVPSDADITRIQNVPEATGIDTTKDLQTRSGSRVTFEGDLSDGRKAFRIHHPFGQSEVQLRFADGRVNNSVGMTSGDDVIVKEEPTVIRFYNVYDDLTVSRSPHATYAAARDYSKHGKVRVGILKKSVKGGKTVKSEMLQTVPKLRTATNTVGSNPYA